MKREDIFGLTLREIKDMASDLTWSNLFMLKQGVDKELSLPDIKDSRRKELAEIYDFIKESMKPSF